MLPAAQFFEHLLRLGERSRFAEDLPGDDHDRVGAEDPGVGVTPGDGERLFLGETQDMFPGGLSPPEGLVDAARHHLEIESHELQQLDPAGRGGGQDEPSRNMEGHAAFPEWTFFRFFSRSFCFRLDHAYCIEEGPPAVKEAGKRNPLSGPSLHEVQAHSWPYSALTDKK